MASSAISLQRINSIWSGAEVSSTGAFKEALQADVLSRLWQSPELMQQLCSQPQSFLQEALGLSLPDTVEVNVLRENVGDTFHFVVPYRPSNSQALFARLEQMGNWWMVAHTFWWHLQRPDKDDFRLALQAMIIGHVWSDLDFKRALLANPKAVLAKEIGLNFPNRIQIQILEDTPVLYHLVVPQPPGNRHAADTSHLSEWQLSEWWMRAHTFWAWLNWMTLHTPLSQ
ncbi:NHLP leader peptide family RiPP precursor [cf. Phormidesmis sp. LEGE 11477]|uniref:NHLP leader peptide family RiPP precursor n=1 Tax=cf. Phormidesmis sp. LEGE 11477 TaxID=1828680 RepID=UPI00187EE884|nr:NHLP leader peptide family RiPP precursor [cf. Phormidesmis sp. LEGE 11477]MBE9062266.1 NHLP leader peptide family RiPP precursor [cf. Phormidesmis sp. LEGE 11477]